MSFEQLEPQHQQVQTIVQSILARGLAEPAIFLLEMGKPLVGCLRELGRMGDPLVRLCFGEGLAGAIEGVLADDANVERIITGLEAGLDGAKGGS